LKNSFKFGFTRTFAVQILIIVLSVVQSVVINRTLIPSDKGIYAVVMRSLNIIVAFFQFGQPEVMLHYFSTNKNNQNHYFANLSFMVILSVLIINIAMFFLINIKSELIIGVGEKRFLPFIFSSLVALNLLNIFYQRIIQLNGNLNNFNFITLFQKIIWFYQ
jgi:O-antigen/teichoic acid export membrane protein